MLLDKKTLSDYVIAAEKACESRLYAAELLQKYVLNCTGVELAITKTVPEEKFFSIGIPARFAREYENFDYLSLNGDGFRTVNAGGSIIFDALTERGLLYAVCDLIEKGLGVRFLTADAEYTPEREGLIVPEGEGVCVPDIARRTYLTGAVYDAATDREFAVKSRSIGYFINIDDKHGGPNRVYGRNNVHNFHFYVPFEKYGNDHPEFYRFMYVNEEIFPTIDLTNGITDDGELDESMDVSVAKIVIAEMKKDIDAYPQADVFNFTQEDGPYCYESARTDALEKKYKRSGILIRFCNVVIRELNKYVAANYKNRVIKLVTFAYAYASEAPVKTVGGKIIPLDGSVVADENIIIQMALFSNGYYSYFSPESEEIAERVREWSVVAKRFWFWAYDINFHRYLHFYDSFRAIAENMKGFKKLGVDYLLVQAAHECRYNWQCNMRGYVYAKLMWDGSADADALMKEYAELYYGPAADSVFEFIELFHRNYADFLENGEDVGFITRGTCEEVKYNPLSLLEKSLAVLDEGEDKIECSDRLTQSEKAEFSKRLAGVKCTPYAMIIDRYFEYYPENSEEDRQKFGKAFIKLCEYGNVDKDCIGERTTMRQYFKELNLIE